MGRVAVQFVLGEVKCKLVKVAKVEFRVSKRSQRVKKRNAS